MADRQAEKLVEPLSPRERGLIRLRLDSTYGQESESGHQRDADIRALLETCDALEERIKELEISGGKRL